MRPALSKNGPPSISPAGAVSWKPLGVFLWQIEDASVLNWPFIEK